MTLSLKMMGSQITLYLPKQQLNDFIDLGYNFTIKYLGLAD